MSIKPLQIKARQPGNQAGINICATAIRIATSYSSIFTLWPGKDMMHAHRMKGTHDARKGV
jgi:hypothetical protein